MDVLDQHQDPTVVLNKRSFVRDPLFLSYSIQVFSDHLKLQMHWKSGLQSILTLTTVAAPPQSGKQNLGTR